MFLQYSTWEAKTQEGAKKLCGLMECPGRSTLDYELEEYLETGRGWEAC